MPSSIGGSSGSGATGGSTGGTGATGATGGTGATAGTGGTGGIGATGGIGGIGGDGGSFCAQTTDSLAVKIDGAPDPQSCAGVASTWEAQGQVVTTSKNAFTMDTCPPNADCAGPLTNVAIDAAGLELWVPEQAFVKVKLELLAAWGGCNQRVSIQNIPSWAGAPNPVAQDGRYYFAGTDGVVEHPDSPFAIAQVALGCVNWGSGCGGLTPDLYALVFTVGPGDPGTQVLMGQTATVNAPMPTWVHNLRSFQSGACDDYWNWGWWAAWVPTSGGG